MKIYCLPAGFFYKFRLRPRWRASSKLFIKFKSLHNYYIVYLLNSDGGSDIFSTLSQVRRQGNNPDNPLAHQQRSLQQRNCRGLYERRFFNLRNSTSQPMIFF